MATNVIKSKNIISGGKNAVPMPKRSNHKKIVNGLQGGSVMTPFVEKTKSMVDTGCLRKSSAVKESNIPATILYKKLPDDMILIMGFEGFLSLDEIFDKYGRVVAKAYFDYPYHMSGIVNSVFLSGFRMHIIAVGQLFSKAEFTDVRNHINKCGCLLHDVIQAVNDGDVKRIEI
jgi:hypothetical protein